MTGLQLAGTPATVEDRQAVLNEVHAELFGAGDAVLAREKADTPPATTAAPAPLSLTDRELIEKASAAKNGAKFAALWVGNAEGYGSQSEADSALCSMLAFWTQDESQLDRLFRASGLMREKWERPDYRARTLALALKNRTDTYAPPVAVTLGGAGAKAATTAEPDPQDAAERRPVLACVESVERQSIRWLWPGRIALGKVSMIAGDPGVAKSHMTLWLASRVSNAGQWPDSNERAPLGQVILLSAEDDIADTIRPRLEATGADLSRVHVLQAVQTMDPKGGKTADRFFNLALDMDVLEAALTQTPDVRLVIIDPITAYLGSAVDSHNNSDIRGLLAPVADLAARFGVAVVCVSHLNKGGKSKAMYRTTGSLAFVAAARAVWAVARDEDDPERRLFLPIKNNLAKDGTGLVYRLEPWPKDANFARCVWDPNPITITAEQALSDEDESERGDRQEAEAWLIEQLGQGAVTSKELLARAKAAGLSWATVRRAKDHAGIVASKDGFTGGWTWTLPKMLKSLEGAHVAPKDIVNTFLDLSHAAAEAEPAKMLTPPAPRMSALGASEHLGGDIKAGAAVEEGTL
jgi:hypothetical protein